MKCDFCSDEGPGHRYAVRSFEVPEVKMASLGDWLACDVCAALIEAGDKAGLLERSRTTYRGRIEWNPNSLRMLKDFHARFWANRI